MAKSMFKNSRKVDIHENYVIEKELGRFVYICRIIWRSRMFFWLESFHRLHITQLFYALPRLSVWFCEEPSWWSFYCANQLFECSFAVVLLLFCRGATSVVKIGRNKAKGKNFAIKEITKSVSKRQMHFVFLYLVEDRISKTHFHRSNDILFWFRNVHNRFDA